MGFHVIWRAARGVDMNELLGHLGLEPSDSTAPALGAPITCVTVGEWSVVSHNRSDAWPHGEMPPSLVATCREIVQCVAEEFMMWSEVTYWSGAAQRWCVRHRGDADVEHLEIEGTPPANLTPIRERRERKQIEAGIGVDHWFDIPIDLAAEIVGYRHNFDPASPWTACEPGSRRAQADPPRSERAPRRPLTTRARASDARRRAPRSTRGTVGGSRTTEHCPNKRPVGFVDLPRSAPPQRNP